MNKIILFGSSAFGFLKSSSILRLSNELRKDGFDVTQIHHFLSFSPDDIEKIIEKFSSSGGTIVGISTSFLSSLSDYTPKSLKEQKPISKWGETSKGEDILKKILHLCITTKKYNCTVVMGGWEIYRYKLMNRQERKAWGIDDIENNVDYFVIGNGASIIKKLASGQKIGTKITYSDPIVDYTDVSSAPAPQDFIKNGESLSFEIAAGCVFSCHFCTYGTLGKKKTEYMRDYESLKRELVSNYENFNTTVYDVTDNIINDYHEKVTFLQRIRDETGIPFRWTGYVRLDTIKNRQQADALRDSGIAGALMGIESFAASTGRFIGKNTDGEKLKEQLHMCRESWGDNALISATFIAGLPTETEDQMIESYKWLISEEGKHLIDTFKFNLLFISPDADDKNEINRNRNNPFKDYKFYDQRKWISPWSTSDRLSELIKVMNKDNINYMGIHSQSLSQYNNLGYDLEELILTVRQRKSFDYTQVYKKHQLNLNDYVKSVMNN